MHFYLKSGRSPNHFFGYRKFKFAIVLYFFKLTRSKLESNFTIFWVMMRPSYSIFGFIALALALPNFLNHFNLGGTFISNPVKFNQLSFEQFVAGETKTIRKTKSIKERDGRLRLLQRIAYWNLRSGVEWNQMKIENLTAATVKYKFC